jgi:hypothetical protein
VCFNGFMVLGALRAVIDELAGLDPVVLADGESVVELHRQLDRLEAITTQATGSFDAGGVWAADGARTAAGWLGRRCHRPKAAARNEVALARALRHLPACAAAWRGGDIGVAHVRVVASLRRPATEARLAADEEMLVGHAKGLAFHHFTKAAAYWEQLAAPDDDDRRARDQQDQRRVKVSQSFGGMWFGDVVLDPIGGSIFTTELARLEKALFDADWADAKRRLGGEREPRAGDLGRSPGQRRADALVEMSIRSQTAPPGGGRRPAPLFTVLVDWETFAGRVCELANATVVAPGSLVAWLEAAWVERVVFGSPSRVLDVGAERRLFVGATRRAIEVRDRECFHDLCDVPACRCQADHIIPFTDGGPTTQANGRMACDFHNRQRHKPQPP